ncbi:AAA family ATPase [Candidatus Woesearchaeota archaeon]|nr:AAA family ATPase [Candidatus Woesearchaeota archaeon]
MKIKRIILKNIRSYVEEEIKFPDGITLLSGDIGSGKSTILLAIDFALFGIRRGELSGPALLRNGCNEGYVNLNLELNNKDIFIKRTLKKSSLGINQNAGYLTIDDKTEELTPIELKQRIIEILNYPQESLTKKSLIYKYTIYTPQEEMKLILLGEKENRLETLRRVFNIDKYKRIRENSKIILSEIKQKKKEFLVLSSDLEETKNKLKDREIDLSKKVARINFDNDRLEETNLKLKEIKERILNFEENIKNLNNLKKDIEIINNNINSKQEIRIKNLNQLKQLIQQTTELQSLLRNKDLQDFKKKIEETEKELEDLEKQLREILNNKISLKSKKQNSEEIKNKIKNLNFCPLCLQEVSHEHKSKINSTEEEKITNLEKDLEVFIKKEEEFSIKIKELKETLGKLRNLEKDQEINKIKSKNLKEKEELVKKLSEEQKEIEKLIDENLEKKLNIEKDLELIKNIEEDYKLTKKQLEDIQQEQKNLELSIVVTKKEQEQIYSDLKSLEENIIKKEQAKQKLDYFNNLQDWFEKFFISIIELMEKKVMLKVHTDFNSLFQNWFSMLINTEDIKVRLDEEFTPLIEQNNHDIEYENLSGGEKTACALAYRLALNQVINLLVSHVNTKDIIILDEPTDGFSTEQLDKLRPVLEELNMKQIILVSHESKIETYADNIIRIQKQGHISKII